MPTETIIIFALAAMLIGLSKGGLGGPVPVSLTAPLLSLVMPVSQAIGIVLPLLLVADAFAIYFYWNTWDTAIIRDMLPASVVGTIIGAVLLAVLPNDALSRLIGLLTLVAVLYKVLQPRLQALAYHPRPWHRPLVGGLAGFGSALANAGAPPFAAYMLLQPDMAPVRFIGTTTLFFAIINLMKVPSFLASGITSLDLLGQTLWALPLIPLGVWTGRYLVRRMNALLFEQIMVVSLFLISIYLIVR
jgi:uncharacterized membrane protein YfcA